MKPARNRPSGKREARREEERSAGEGLRLVRPEDDRTATDPAQGTTRRLQVLYRQLAEAVYPELRRRADGGEEQARRLLARLSRVGDRLGVRFPDRDPATPDLTATAQSLVRQSFARRRVPRATYRLQFNRDFTFRDACDLVGYLHDLGVSDCYASPILQARAGSTHGYDICDHSRLNPDLGSAADLDALAAALRERGMGLIL